MSERRVVRSAALVLVGAELLSGKIADANTLPLAKTLRALGIPLRRVVIVSDDRTEIAHDIRQLVERYDVVFTSGGVGPTHDDVTIDAVADAAGVDVVMSEQLLSLVDQVYGSRVTDAHRRMARVPSGAELVDAVDVRWPALVLGKVWTLPGVPELFRMKLSLVRERLVGPATLHGESLFTSKDELDLKAALDDVVKAHPTVEIGSYPRWFDPRYRTRLTFDSTDRTALERALDDMRERLAGTLLDLDVESETDEP